MEEQEDTKPQAPAASPDETRAEDAERKPEKEWETQADKAEKDEFGTEARRILGLEESAPDEVVLGALKAASEKAGLLDASRAELAEMKESAERKRKNELIEQGLEDGRLTRDLAENWAARQDSATLEAYLEHAPHLIPVARPHREERKREGSVLTDMDRKMIRMFGFREDEYLQAKDA